MMAVQSVLSMSCLKQAWSPPIILTEAKKANGVDELYKTIVKHGEYLKKSGELVLRRQRGREKELLEKVENGFINELDT